MRGHNPQGGTKIKPTDQVQNSADLLISFFWLFCCLSSVMRIMFGVRTEVRHFHIILKEALNTAAALSSSAALGLGLCFHIVAACHDIRDILRASSHSVYVHIFQTFLRLCLPFYPPEASCRCAPYLNCPILILCRLSIHP